MADRKAYEEILLAEANDEDGTAWVRLYDFRFDWEDMNFVEGQFYVVKRRVMDWDEGCYDLFFNDLRSAMKAFGKEANRKYRMGKHGELRKVYGKVKYCENWWSWREELLPSRNAERSGDYSPSNPWDAPGMKISDFIGGVY